MARRSIDVRRLVPACMLASLLIAGCASGTASTSSPIPAPTAAPTAQAGPASFADWTARQGFGGASGLTLFSENVQFMVNHPSDMTAFFVDEDEGDIAGLADWLDGHPATACWADYHAAVQSGLAELAADYEKVRAAVDAGNLVPSALSSKMAANTTAMLAMKAPANCP